MGKDVYSNINTMHLQICRNCNKVGTFDGYENNDINPAYICHRIRFCSESSVLVGKRKKEHCPDSGFENAVGCVVKPMYQDPALLCKMVSGKKPVLTKKEKSKNFDELEKVALSFRYFSSCPFRVEHTMIDCVNQQNNEVEC